jgi:ankyrin repeat protein
MNKPLLLSFVLILTIAGAQNPLGVEHSFVNYEAYQKAWENATVEDLQAWLETQPDLEAKDSNSWTILVRVAHHNRNPEVIKFLLNAGANPNTRYLSNWTPLMSAAQWNNPAVVQALIEAGADVNAKGDDGETVIMYAAKWNRNPEVITTLIEAGADPMVKDPYGSNLLMLAAEHNDNPEVIQKLLATGLEINFQKDYGTSALMIAAMSWNSKPQIVQALIEGGAELDMQDDWGRTALFYACTRNEIEVVKVLLAAGANPTIAAKNGLTVLQVATENHYQEIVDLLKAVSP